MGSVALDVFVGTIGAVVGLNSAVVLKPITTCDGRSLCSYTAQISRQNSTEQSRRQ